MSDADAAPKGFSSFCVDPGHSEPESRQRWAAELLPGQQLATISEKTPRDRKKRWKSGHAGG
jgi:hypothetical protein